MGSCFSQQEECSSYPKAIMTSNNLPIDKVYTLKKKIGGGAFGTVWLSHRKDYPNYKFAIKKINKQEVGKDLDLLLREVNILKEVDHPNIIKLFEVYEDINHIFIVMEYCSGGELFTKITSMGHLHEAEARVYMRKILMAVSHLHSLNIVHRDLKTENFLFDSPCATKELKLVDFGLSNKFGTRFEQLHSKVGTIYYVAPEVLKGNYDYKCDLWSVGVLMYTMLSGDLPFYDEALSEVYNKLKTGEYSLEKPIWATVSQEAKDLISKLLTISVSERYSAVDALHHDWFLSLPRRQSCMTASIYESLKDFKRKSVFEKEALRLMVKMIPEEKFEKLKEIFFSIDLAGTGMVRVEDLVKSMAEIENFNQEEINEMVRAMDLNNTGIINYSEFVSAALHMKKELVEDSLWITFKQLDIDNKGLLTEESLRRTIDAVGRNATQEQIQSIIETVNSEGGMITFQAFKDIILGKI